ncbi:MAG: class I SAM-dependent methyltransferase [Vicinamibacterales bacterium]
MTLRMYSELASWWPLLSPPSHYIEEAADLLPVLIGATEAQPRTLLELGSGGGSLAYHLKNSLDLTLTDRSPEMLAVNKAVNPECEHALGDMTSLDLGREFDRVLVHDAIMYATDRDALRATMRTAYRHCRPGGAAVFVPDHVRETFAPATETGGEDGPDGRGLRYLEWSWDPDSTDDTYEVAYAFLLRGADGRVQVEGEQHLRGCFARADWLECLRETGFEPRVRTDPWDRDVFVGLKHD